MTERAEWRRFVCRGCGRTIETDREQDEDAPDYCASCEPTGHVESEWDL